MNISFKLSPNAQFSNGQPGQAHELPEPLATLLEETPANPKLLKLFTRQDFQLGDDLGAYRLPELRQDNAQQQPESGVYLVCQGRVRLLAFDGDRQREVPAQLLGVGALFGVDHLFCNHPLPYRAVAASAGQIAWLAAKKLPTLLKQMPQLRELLHQQAQEREHLIFFKTVTELRSLPSSQLQQLASQVVQHDISAGEAIAPVLPSTEERFWLRQGSIQSSQASQPPAIGGIWGYPEPTPGDWVAQTTVHVYGLPREPWETIQALTAGAATAASSKPKVPTNSPSQESTQRKANRPLGSQPSSPYTRNGRSETQQAALPASQPTSAPVAFPQPAPRRYQQQRLWRRYPFIQQQSAADCGATCLAMIAQYWGKRLSLNVIRDLAGVSRAGASLKGLTAAAEQLGFQARPVRASLGRLAEQTTPWIAHWQGDHYVVVYRVKKDRILIADPALGRRLLSRQEFLASWTGYALLLDPTERVYATNAGEERSLSNLFGLLWPHRLLILQIILASLLIQVFGLVTPLFTQIILDRVVVQRSLITLHVFALGLLIFGIWRVGLTAVRQYLLDFFSNRLDLTLISGFVSHTLLLPLKFFTARHVGDITTRVEESQKIQLFLTRQVIIAWLDMAMAVVYVGLMAYYNWHLTLLVLALIPPIVILTLGATPLLRRVSREVFNEAARENSALVEMITGIATVKATAAEQEVRWRWEDFLTTTLNARFRGQKLGNGLHAASGLINSLGNTALLWYGATLVIQGELTIGQFVAFNMLIGNVINPILGVVKLWDEFQEVTISVERLNDVFSAQPEENPQRPMLSLPPIRGEVRFENVTFRYGADDDRNTLENISFEVRAGQTVAIVGRSGSGKTTLVNLLQGLYQPQRGCIWIDGHDVHHVSPKSLRSQLGVVPQECFLFSGTILENIALYRPEFSLEQVIEVAKLAEAHAFIQSLPLGYNTKVGERGATLSGGQRQRIAIARALLGNPRILILDEATSSLDSESERRFQQNLAQISRDRTTFIIAHRLSTVQHADNILVLNQGVLVEQGNHAELIALRGLYYHLAQQQLNL